MYDISFISENSKKIIRKNSESLPLVGDYVGLNFDNHTGSHIVLGREFDFQVTNGKHVAIYVKDRDFEF